jgi:predicted Ser/Thr protein kinase
VNCKVVLLVVTSGVYKSSINTSIQSIPRLIVTHTAESMFQVFKNDDDSKYLGEKLGVYTVFSEEDPFKYS